MEETAKLLIVEDEMIIGANLSLQLTGLGYEVIGIIPRGEEAIQFVRNNQPDILLMDINLKGQIDGVEAARIIQQEYDIPIIYITANSDEVNFNRAKSTKPQGFITKPFKKLELQRTIELTLSRVRENKQKKTGTEAPDVSQFVLGDSIFVKDHEKMVKIVISDILYVEAERNYCRIYARNKEYLLVMTLKELDRKLPVKHFIRIHRSYIINISKIEEIGNTYVVVAKKTVPMSKGYRDELLQRLQTI
jgi:DNA-binding LytR/AlgR family response regulator